MSPLPHSKLRKRLQAWGPSPTPLVGTCCMQNTVRWGEEKTRRKCAYSGNGDKAQACQESLEEVKIQGQERGRSGRPPPGAAKTWQPADRSPGVREMGLPGAGGAASALPLRSRCTRVLGLP